MNLTVGGVNTCCCAITTETVIYTLNAYHLYDIDESVQF